jgi:hypothetical protein
MHQQQQWNRDHENQGQGTKYLNERNAWSPACLPIA